MDHIHARKPRLWRTLAVLVCGLFLVIELGFRAARIGFPRLWHADEQLGHSLRPGAAGWCTDEGDAWVEVNALGMRDRERVMARAPNTLRIAVLGDSMTEARQVAREETYVALLETALAQRPELAGRTPEILNFGVTGYSTGQEVLQYRDVVTGFKPDIVLLAFTPANDVHDNHAALGGPGVRPYFRRDGRKVMLDERFRAEVGHRDSAQPFLKAVDVLSDYSRLVQIIAHRTLDEKVLTLAPGGYFADERAYGPSPDDDWREAWVITERLLITLRDDCLANGARLMVLGATYGPQVHPDPAAREALARKLGQADLLYPESRMAPFLVGNSIPFLPLAAVFQRRATTTKLFYHGFAARGTQGRGHWNKDGHALAAELVTPWLAQHVSP